MFDRDLMEYRLTEDKFDHLLNARHLVNLLAELSIGDPSKTTVELNRESLATTFDVIGGMMESALPELCPNKQEEANQ